MNSIFETMLVQYGDGAKDKKNVVKEIIQEIVLCGLSRAGFFNRAAFYGGTALRIFYGLDRFSEDLDFSLTSPDESFSISEYLPMLQKEVNAFGLNVTVNEKEKTTDSNIKSAFLKGNTLEHMLMFYPDDTAISAPANEVIKIKIEVDINPPTGATFEHKYRLLPSPYQVQLYDLPSLFAGKIHAVICRSWKNRIKGRDLYDYIFYLSHNAAVNLTHLKARLVDSGYIDESFSLTRESLIDILSERFSSIDYAQAESDVMPFIKNAAQLDIWSSEFFIDVTKNLKIR